MDFGFEKIMDFIMNIDKLKLANLVGEVMDKIEEFQFFFTFRKLYQKVKHHGFWRWENNGLQHDKLNLANLVGKVMDEIMESINYTYHLLWYHNNTFEKTNK